MNSLGLYIHFPYCIHTCVYCDFNVYVVKAKSQIDDYLKALKEEISFYAKQFPRHIDTLYFGGGTPSLLSIKHISELLDFIRKEFNITSSCEISLEANPYIPYEKLQGFKEAGVNRLSFGIQTFHSQHLKTLERLHSPKQALTTFEHARKAGFKNINVDFIFGIPNQTVEQFQEDIFQALTLDPEHISTYNLTLEESNPLLPHLPHEDIQVQMYTWVSEYLSSKGYEHYETSAFAQNRKKSRHNLKYWKLSDYLGLGAGAYSYMREKETPWGTHFKNVDNVKSYCQKVMGKECAIEEKEVLSKETAKKDYMQTHLRLLSEGVAEEDFEKRFQESFNQYGGIIHRLQKEGFLDSREKMLTLTSKGKLYLNQVLLEFM